MSVFRSLYQWCLQEFFIRCWPDGATENLGVAHREPKSMTEFHQFSDTVVYLKTLFLILYSLIMMTNADRVKSLSSTIILFQCVTYL